MIHRPITLLLAAPRGFCAGVERAVQIVERALERYGAPVYVRHEIVHNRYVVESLEAKGAVFVDELETIPDDDFGEDVRTVTVEFEEGSEQIDYVGTMLVPEFGVIAAIILAVTIVGIIVATTRYSKFSFLPKM